MPHALYCHVENAVLKQCCVQADALTTAELEAYREEVREKLQQAGEHSGRPVMHTFSDAQLEAAGDVRQAIF